MALPTASGPPVVLFGYDSSPFTQKVRLALQLKQIPYTFVIVPSMMPRPVLREYFNVTYRKIPVLAIGRDVYIDTSLILEALEHRFPPNAGYRTIYPDPSQRPIIRGFASYWTDRPFFRVTTGLIPATVWRTSFGVDRANLIGHKLDPDKLERKVPENLSGLDLQLSLFEPLTHGDSETGRVRWLFGTSAPSAADIAVFYQLDWGEKIGRGEGVRDLTGGGAEDYIIATPSARPSASTSASATAGISFVFNETRYPGLWRWFRAFRTYVDALPDTTTRVEKGDDAALARVLAQLSSAPAGSDAQIPLVPTPAVAHTELHEQIGLKVGVEVSVAPDDTGRNAPTLGTLLAMTAEEVVIRPAEVDGRGPSVGGDVRVHFPRVGFVVRPVVGAARL